MSRPAFDTLKYTQSLEESGVDRKQAEAFAKAQKESLKELMEETLATKEDLQEVKSELKEDLLAVKAELKEDLLAVKAELKSDLKNLVTKEELTYKLKDLENRLTIRLGVWMVGSLTVTTGILGFLMDWIVKGVH
jgi:predicted phage-related endonuclease